MNTSLPPWLSITLFTLVACLFAGKTYSLGYTTAEARGLAALNALAVEQAEAQRQRAEAYGQRLSQLLDEQRKAVARADALSAALDEATAGRAAASARIRKEIPGVTRNSTHTFDGDYVRLLNQAAGVSGDAVSGAVCAVGAAPDAAACAAP